jgi:hypothetical protein
MDTFADSAYGLAWLLLNLPVLAVPLLVALFAAGAAGLFLLRGFLRWCLGPTG